MADNWEEKIKELRKITEFLSDADFIYRLHKHATAYKMVLTHYATFKVGDRVQLARTPNLAHSPGWHGCEHFLVEGAKATVVSSDIDPDDGAMRYNISFDDESWRDDKGVLHMVENRHTFFFGESSLVSMQQDTETKQVDLEKKEAQKLKPCPFCGSHQVHFTAWGGTDDLRGFAECTTCTAKGPMVFCPPGVEHRFSKIQVMATEEWNRRS